MTSLYQEKRKAKKFMRVSTFGQSVIP